MRVQDGAKTASKSGLFFSVKIVRIHCKKIGFGGPGTILKTYEKKRFCFFAKNVIFHDLWFYLNKTEVCEVQGPDFSGFLSTFFSVFFWSPFLLIFIENSKNIVNYSVFGSSRILSAHGKIWFFSKKVTKTELEKNVIFCCVFRDLSFSLGKIEVFGGSRRQKNNKKSSFFLHHFLYVLTVIFLPNFCLKIVIFRDLWFYLSTIEVFAAKAFPVTLTKMSSTSIFPFPGAKKALPCERGEHFWEGTQRIFEAGLVMLICVQNRTFS